MAAAAAIPPAGSARRVLIPLDVAPAVRLRGADAQVHALGGATMGTGWSVKLVAPSVPASSLRAGIEAVLDRVIAQMSTWIAESDISRFNGAPAGTWHVLPDDFLRVLRAALTVAAQSGGAYDPTVGALVDLWGFGPHGVPRRPGDAAIAAARADCGWQHLKVEGSRALQRGSLRLDLSSIAKGFAVDAVSAHLAGRGIADHLVEIGGELRGQGIKPDGSPWWVALERPAAERGEQDRTLDTIVALHGLSVATSGDSRRFFISDGRRFSHTIDPRTGYPVPERAASVTVLHQHCIYADAWASALLVLGPEEGLVLAERLRLPVRFIVRNGLGYEERISAAMAALID
jgi:FAD:protein FMN transferase